MIASCRLKGGIPALLTIWILLAGELVHSAEPREGIAGIPGGDPEVVMRVVKDPASGQFDITEGARPILRYNYRNVELPEGFLEKVHPDARQYARPRSDYIHPLYGPDGEVLTKDWSVDHPHHRGIYWAWPEVYHHGERGDLHALQRVFARPTGGLRTSVARDYAQIEAENLWKWEDRVPIVRERAIIRAYRSGEQGRCVDLTFRFTALEDDVFLARVPYGGMNIRLSPVKDYEVVLHTDPPGAEPRRAWADSVGVRAGGKGPLGMAIFQKTTNPHYPGEWVNYDGLPWLQPAFPTQVSGDRYALKKEQPLLLEYRLWIHRRGKAPLETYARRWDEFNK